MGAKTVSQYIGAITIIWVPKLCHHKWTQVMGAKTVLMYLVAITVIWVPKLCHSIWVPKPFIVYGSQYCFAVYRCNNNHMGAKTVIL